MKKFEKILIGIAVIGIIFKSFKLTGSAIITMLPILILSGLYYPLGIFLFNEIKLKDALKKVSYSGISLKRILGSVIVGMALSVGLMSVLFSLMSWPGSSAMRIIGLGSITPALFISINKYNQTKNIFYKNLIIRMIVTILIITVCFFLPHSMRFKKPKSFGRKPGMEQVQNTATKN